MNIRCTNFQPHTNDSLKGFASIKFLDIGLELRDVTLHEKDGKQFISMPSKAYFKNGEKTFFHTAVFPDIRERRNFERLALEAINDFMCQGEGRKHAVSGG